MPGRLLKCHFKSQEICFIEDYSHCAIQDKHLFPTILHNIIAQILNQES